MYQGMRVIVTGLLYWLVIFPAWIVVEVLVELFDKFISRHLFAAVLLSPWWLGCLFTGTVPDWLIWANALLGTMLCGFWDGCDILTIRPYLSRLGIVKSKDEFYPG